MDYHDNQREGAANDYPETVAELEAEIENSRHDLRSIRVIPFAEGFRPFDETNDPTQRFIFVPSAVFKEWVATSPDPDPNLNSTLDHLETELGLLVQEIKAVILRLRERKDGDQ